MFYNDYVIDKIIGSVQITSESRIMLLTLVRTQRYITYLHNHIIQQYVIVKCC